MFLFSFVKSFVLYPNHYEWAAFQRDGIGLSYLFGLGAFLASLGLMFYPLPIVAMFMAEVSQLGLPDMITDQISEYAKTYVYLFYPAIIALIGLGYAISIFNMSLIATIFISAPFNFVTSWAGDDLTFLQLLRVSCYSVTAATIFSALALGTLGAGPIVILLIYLFYICAPIIYLKMIHDL